MPLGMLGSFIVPLVSSALGAGSSLWGTGQALGAQEKGMQTSQADILKMFGIGQQAVQPGVNLFAGAAPELGAAIAPGSPFMSNVPVPNAPAPLTEATLQATPGYQFALNQGLKSTQNGFAARGLGESGAAMKGAASFATGLADQTYQQQYQNQLAQFGAQSNVFGMNQQNLQRQFGNLMGAAGLGSGSAGNLFTGAMGAGNSLAQLGIGGANAAGAAYTSAGNTMSNLFNTAGGYAYMAPYMNSMYGGGGGGSMYAGMNPFYSQNQQMAA